MKPSFGHGARHVCAVPCLVVSCVRFYFTQSVFEVVLQKSTPPQISQCIFCACGRLLGGPFLMIEEPLYTELLYTRLLYSKERLLCQQPNGPNPDDWVDRPRAMGV